MLFSKKVEKVSIHGRSRLKYQQQGKSIEFAIEMMAGQPDIVIYLDKTVCWEGDNNPISASEIALIKKNIEEELSHKSITVEWE